MRFNEKTITDLNLFYFILFFLGGMSSPLNPLKLAWPTRGLGLDTTASKGNQYKVVLSDRLCPVIKHFCHADLTHGAIERFDVMK